MDLNKIKKMASEMGINPNKMKKTEIIQAIQRAEKNIDCFATQRVESCHEERCLWRDDCLLSLKN